MQILKIKESWIIRQVGDYLNWKQLFFYRNNTGAVKAAYTVTKGELAGTTHFRFTRFGVKGMPDFVAIKFGVYIGIEVKTPTGKQSPEQVEFEKSLKLAGAEYWLVRSVEELDVKFKEFERKHTC